MGVLNNQVPTILERSPWADGHLALDGHKHFYERFTKLDPLGNIDANGAREFIVRSHGESHGSTTMIRT